MTLQKDDLMDLMAYADGELEGEAKARVEELLATREDARAVVSSFGTLTEVVGRVEDGRARRAGADGVADAVLQRIVADESSVVAFPTKSLPPRKRPAQPRSATVATAVAGLALAATMAFWWRTAHPPDEGHQGGGVASEEVLLPNGEVAASEDGVEVEDVDSTLGPVDVFFIPSRVASQSTANASSVVVWITEPSRPEGDH